MTSKRSSASAKKELRTTIKKLRSELDRADQRAQRLKGKVARVEKTNTKLEARVKSLKRANKRLEKAPRPAEPTRAPVPHEPPVLTEDPPSDLPARTRAPSPTAANRTVSPDAGWTVTQLRAEARSRGLTGLSRKTKAELLAALR